MKIRYEGFHKYQGRVADAFSEIRHVYWRLTRQTMDQRIINLYDSFTHGGMNRREFLDQLAKLAGSATAAAALLPLLQNDYAQAAFVADNDARLAADHVAYDSPKGKINGYLV